jgi:hypothetical protein
LHLLVPLVAQTEKSHPVKGVGKQPSHGVRFGV